jgi:hypothetical protein
MSGEQGVVQDARDEFARMRAHLFEMIEAMGLPDSQEKGAKGLIRTITYDSQASVEAALRRRSNNHARQPSQ